MNRKLLHTVAVIALSALALTGCSSEPASPSGSSADAASTSATPEAVEAAPEAPAAPLDLTGDWTQTNAEGDPYQTASIAGGVVTVTWVNDAQSTKALFWAGSYVPPTEAGASYSWDSVNDTAQTDASILASGDPTKTFTYADGTLSYDVTALGVTKTVKLERQ
jgi:hypothetical protein